MTDDGSRTSRGGAWLDWALALLGATWFFTPVALVWQGMSVAFHIWGSATEAESALLERNLWAAGIILVALPPVGLALARWGRRRWPRWIFAVLTVLCTVFVGGPMALIQSAPPTPSHVRPTHRGCVDLSGPPISCP